MTVTLTSVHSTLNVGEKGVLELGTGTRTLGTDEQTCNLIIIAYQLETIPYRLVLCVEIDFPSCVYDAFRIRIGERTSCRTLPAKSLIRHAIARRHAVIVTPSVESQ